MFKQRQVLEKPQYGLRVIEKRLGNSSEIHICKEGGLLVEGGREDIFT